MRTNLEREIIKKKSQQLATEILGTCKNSQAGDLSPGKTYTGKWHREVA